MINWTRVAELEEDLGPDDMVEVFAVFRAEAEEVIDRLACLPDPLPQASEQLQRDMHFLRGCAVNLGLDSLGDLCDAAEANLASGRPDKVHLDEIVASYQRSVAAFRAALSPNDPN